MLLYWPRWCLSYAGKRSATQTHQPPNVQVFDLAKIDAKKRESLSDCVIMNFIRESPPACETELYFIWRLPSCMDARCFSCGMGFVHLHNGTSHALQRRDAVELVTYATQYKEEIRCIGEPASSVPLHAGEFNLLFGR
jgi:hypothetical protein